MDLEANQPAVMFLGGRASGRSERVTHTDQREFTVKEYAHRERVDERTVRRWIAKGALQVRRTGFGAGKGIRIYVG